MIVAVVLIIVLLIALYPLVALPEPEPMKSEPAPERPVDMYNEVQVKNPKQQPNAVFNQQWQLPRDDEGAFTFTACAPSGGLVIYLSDSPNSRTLLDSRGYAVVLDDQQNPSKTYIGKLPNFLAVDTRRMVSRANYNFRVNSNPAVCRQYWVIYKNGNVMVGEGADMNDKTARLVVCLEGDREPPSGVRYFGFGSLRREDVGITIKDIQTFDAPRNPPRECSSLVPSPKTPSVSQDL